MHPRLRRLLEILLPERQLDAAAREELDQESREINVSRARFWALPLIVMQSITVWFTARLPVASAAEFLWHRDLTRIHTAILVTDLVMFTCILLNRGPARIVVDRLGPIYQLLALFEYALIAVNAQRLHGSLGPYMAIVVGTPYVIRASTGWFFGSLVLSSSVLVAGIALVQQSPVLRPNHIFTVVAFSVFGAVIGRMNAASIVKDLLNRRALRKLNAELESRVQKQVGEIVERAKEIERLNERLDAQVRERSRELSSTLERLARGDAPLSQVRPGDVLANRVEVQKLIGSGAMGVVFRGRDRVLGCEVAVKVVQAASVRQFDALHRFLREAELLATVRHPAIVRSLHVDVSDDGRLYQVLELVDGVTLDKVFSAGVRFTGREAAAVGAVAARALEASHERGIIHRDVKPSNFMVTSAEPHVKLLDFGISKVREADRASSKLTQEGVLLGTPAYMSPEQVLTPETVGPPSDVYSLGLVLYLALAGRGPFDADSAGALLNSQVARQPAALIGRVPGLDEEVARHVMSCLVKNPAARPTAADLAAALEASAARLGSARLDVGEWIATANARRPEPPTPPVNYLETVRPRA